jgi:hypothetical protein
MSFSTDLPSFQAVTAGTRFSYTATRRWTIGDDEPWDSEYQGECVVRTPGPASALHPALEGAAFPVECAVAVDGGPGISESGLLLPAVGWYVPQTFENSFFRSKTRVVDIELARSTGGCPPGSHAPGGYWALAARPAETCQCSAE